MNSKKSELDEITRLLSQLDRLIGQVRGRAIPIEEDDASSLDAHARIERDHLLRRPRPPLPDPRLVRRIIRQRRLRDRYFPRELFADPGWDILLELAASRAEGRRISVTSLCAAAAVPDTTALRWITMMTETGLLVGERDDLDRRRRFVALAETTAKLMARYFDELGTDAARLI